MMHLRLEPSTEAAFAVPQGANAVLHTIAGEGSVDGTALKEHDVALIAHARPSLQIRASGEPFEALLVAGMPLGEPIARYGPFVMTSRDELEQAFLDYRAGRFGEIARTN